MKIIEYSHKYIEYAKDLLVKLQEYIVGLDKYGLNTLSNDYRDKYFELTYAIAYSNKGKIYLAIQDDVVIGIIAGHIRKYSSYDSLDYTCPNMGVVQELYVLDEYARAGVGTKLMDKMENYFKKSGCLYSTLEVFAYNEKAKRFYEKLDYSDRLISMIKKF